MITEQELAEMVSRGCTVEGKTAEVSPSTLTLCEDVHKIVLELDPVPAPRLNKKSRFNPEKHKSWARYMQYKHNVWMLATEKGWDPKVDELHVVFVIAMPKSWTNKKRKEMLHKHHQQTPDTKNLYGALEDALFPGGDAHVWKQSSEKRWGLSGRVIINLKGETS